MDNVTESQEQPTTSLPPTQLPVAVTEPQRKSRFVEENDLEKIELGDGDWVMVPAKFSYEFTENFQYEQDPKERIAAILSVVIKKWNLVDHTGQVAPITLDLIKKLEVADLEKIFKVVLKKVNAIDPPKAESPLSAEQSPVEEQTPQSATM
jgi:hypothetical protein